MASAARYGTELSILVVDDGHGFSQWVSDLLSMMNVKLTAAASTEETLRLIKEDMPNLLIVDPTLAGREGYDLVRKVRGMPEAARLPIVVVSGLVREGDLRAALEAGASAFLPKPFDLFDLQRAVRPFLGDWLTWSAPRPMEVIVSSL
jgi:CheY-like chemotaxis protein